MRRVLSTQPCVSPATEPARLLPPTSAYADAQSPKNRVVGGWMQTLVGPPLTETGLDEVRIKFFVVLLQSQFYKFLHLQTSAFVLAYRIALSRSQE